MLVLHIRSLEEETLARKIYETQKEKRWPGLAKEASKICEELSIVDVNDTNMSKKEYRKIVIKACQDKDEEKLRKEAEEKEKCRRIMKDKYGKKEYFKNKNIKEVRNMFKTRVSMLPFAGNYTRDKRFLKTLWMCRCNEKKEEETHILEGKCPIYKDIFEKYDNFEEDEVIVQFFSEVLARRDALDDGTLVAEVATDASLGEGTPSPSQPV